MGVSVSNSAALHDNQTVYITLSEFSKVIPREARSQSLPFQNYWLNNLWIIRAIHILKYQTLARDFGCISGRKLKKLSPIELRARI